MTATSDLVLERRRVRRRLAFWRIIAIVALVVAFIAMIPRGAGQSGPHIALVSIDGIILEDHKRDRMIASIAEDDDAEAMIVQINSPGGTVAASESLYLAIRKVAEQKPVAAVMGEVAASGGYAAAIGADHILARGNTLTGSIGVYMDAPDVSGLLDQIGVDVTRVRSAPLKGEPSISAPMSEQALAAQQELINDTFVWFRDLVGERRTLTGAALERVTDGRAFTGRQALELGLIDSLGDAETARDWFAENKGIDPDRKLRDRTWRDDELPWLMRDLDAAVSAFERIERYMGGFPRLYAVTQ